jgi:hypothetical protein
MSASISSLSTTMATTSPSAPSLSVVNAPADMNAAQFTPTRTTVRYIPSDRRADTHQLAEERWQREAARLRMLARMARTTMENPWTS